MKWTDSRGDKRLGADPPKNLCRSGIQIQSGTSSKIWIWILSTITRSRSSLDVWTGKELQTLKTCFDKNSVSNVECRDLVDSTQKQHVNQPTRVYKPPSNFWDDLRPVCFPKVDEVRDILQSFLFWRFPSNHLKFRALDNSTRRKKRLFVWFPPPPRGSGVLCHITKRLQCTTNKDQPVDAKWWSAKYIYPKIPQWRNSSDPGERVVFSSAGIVVLNSHIIAHSKERFCAKKRIKNVFDLDLFA